MKVYIVLEDIVVFTDGYYGDAVSTSVVGVYDSEEKANKRVEELRLKAREQYLSSRKTYRILAKEVL